MPVRRFDGVDDAIRASVGACNLTGAFSMAALVRSDTTGPWQGIVSNRTTTETAWALQKKPAGVLSLEHETNGSESKLSVADDMRWYLLVVTKATGTATPRFHRYDFSTKTWTHENGNVSLGNRPTQAGGAIHFAEYTTASDNFMGDFAAVAEWAGTALTDGQCESLVTASDIKKGWKALSPSGLWCFDQAAVTTSVEDLTGNGANQTSRTGTEVVAEEPPIPYELKPAEGKGSGSGTGSGSAKGTRGRQAKGTGAGSGGGSGSGTRGRQAKGTGQGSGGGSASGSRGRQAKGSASGSGSGSGSGTRGGQGKGAGQGAGAGTGKATRGRQAKAQGAGSGSGKAAGTATKGERNTVRPRQTVPMRQTLICRAPSGKVYRWAEYANAGRIFTDLSDSGAVPGGDRDMTVTLPRKDGVDYGDMIRGSIVEIFGAGNQLLGTYRLERAPIVSGDYISIAPAASGIEADLTRNSAAQEIFIDADIGGFGTASAKRRAAQTHRFDNATIQVVPAGTPDPENPTVYSDSPALVHSWASYNNTGASDVAESWYDGMGVPLGEAHLDFVPVKGTTPGTAAWENQAMASVDGITLNELLVDLNATGATHQELEIPAGRFFLMLRDYLSSGKEGAVNYEFHWKNVRILGRHGLPLYGTWPRVGLLASDVVAYVLARWAPHIHFTTGPYGTIKPTRFPIPHLVFKEPTTPAEMIQQATRFEQLEYGVWAGPEGPTFYMNPRGQREGAKRWRVRSSEIEYEDTGQQLDKVFNGVVVTGQAADGTTLYIGPAGSGLRYTSPGLRDLDPQNAANEAGIEQYAKIQMKGIATLEGMVEAGEAFLEQSKLLDGSGKATVTGYVEDENGKSWPYYYMKEGHEIEVLGSSIPGPRYIVASSRSRSSRSVAIDIDAPPDSFEAMMERLNAEYIGIALASG